MNWGPELIMAGLGGGHGGAQRNHTGLAHVDRLVVAPAQRPDLQTRTIYHEARVAAKQLIEIPRPTLLGRRLVSRACLLPSAG